MTDASTVGSDKPADPQDGILADHPPAPAQTIDAYDPQIPDDTLQQQVNAADGNYVLEKSKNVRPVSVMLFSILL